MTFGVCIVIGLRTYPLWRPLIKEPFMMIVYVAYVWTEGVGI